MNQTLSRQIVASLNVTGSLHPSTENLSLLSRDEWKKVLRWLDEGGLTLTYWKHLNDAGEEQIAPPEVRARLEQNLEDHRLRIAQMISEFDLINSRFEAARIPYAVLKGFALIPEYCPDIVLRTTYDYDYLLPREAMESAGRTLRVAGYLRKKERVSHPVAYFDSTRHPRSPLTRDDLYSAAFPRTIELHYLFWDSEQFKIPLALPSDILDRRQLRRLGVSTHPEGSSLIQFYSLSEEDELLFQVLHVFRHILHSWCRLSSLLDIAHFLGHRAFDTAFWDRFLDRLGVSRPPSEIAGLVFLLAARLFGATIPAPVSVQIVDTLRRSLVVWVERYGRESALSNFSDNKFSLFLHGEFIANEADWREIRRTRLFPIQRPSQPIQATASTPQARFVRAWKQGLYVSQRLSHHVLATLQYELESPRWYRARSRNQ